MNYQSHERAANPSLEGKYNFQIGMKDIDFEVNFTLLRVNGFELPLKGIDQAENALRDHILSLSSFLEIDNTEHQVLSFDPRPIGYSGFMNCVKHSLMMTNHGVFEVGRYAGINLEQMGHSWRWFLHRRLIEPIQVSYLLDERGVTPDQFIQDMTQLILDQ